MVVRFAGPPHPGILSDNWFPPQSVVSTIVESEWYLSLRIVCANASAASPCRSARIAPAPRGTKLRAIQAPMAVAVAASAIRSTFSRCRLHETQGRLTAASACWRLPLSSWTVPRLAGYGSARLPREPRRFRWDDDRPTTSLVNDRLGSALAMTKDRCPPREPCVVSHRSPVSWRDVTAP